MHVSFYGGHNYLASNVNSGFPRLLLFQIGCQVGDRLFHYPSTFYHLGKEHLSVSEEVSYGIHAFHQGALNHPNRIL